MDCTRKVIPREESKIAKSNPKLKKIRIRIPAEDGWQTESEWLWAERVNRTVFALRNVPYYRYGLSYDDRVRVKEKDGWLEMAAIVGRGGHSTYRLISKKGFQSKMARQALNELVKSGCDLEWNTDLHVAVDVPPTTDIHAVYGLLKRAERNSAFAFEEGHFGHPVKK